MLDIQIDLGPLVRVVIQEGDPPSVTIIAPPSFESYTDEQIFELLRAAGKVAALLERAGYVVTR